MAEEQGYDAEAELVTGPHVAGEGRRPARAPEVWGRIPPRNKNFTGRGPLLTSLRAGIIDTVTAVVPHALHGLGGVGKTQMAVEYAYRFSDDYDLIWWIPADQPVLVRSSLAALAPHLGLPPATATGIEEAANSVLDALRRGHPYDRWLLIFDNADQPEDINDIIPRGPGHVLITSRNHRWDGVVETVPVDVFTREESIEFLTKRVPRSITPEDAERLAEELGDLPLALEQTGALQAETGMSVDTYLRLLKEHTTQLLSEGKPTEYPVSMTAAWSLSVTSLRERMPEAVDLLRCCAFFGPEPIPRDVFSQSHVTLRPEIAALLADPIRLSRAVGELGRYALARIDPRSRTIQVHRLIQALVRDELTSEEQALVRSDVHQLLVGTRPDNPEETVNWRRYADLLAHIEPSEVAESAHREVRGFALDVIRYLYISGDFRSAQIFADRFIGRWRQRSGSEDPDVLRAYRELGNVLRELGKYNDAYKLNRDTLQNMQTTGMADEDTLLVVNSIGADLRARGDFVGAREHDEDSRRRHERAFGPEDIRTLRAINNLALDYSLNSDFIRSKELHEIAYLGLRRAVKGVGAAFILATWSGLTRSVRLCGDYAEACDLGEDAYAYGVDLLGPEHPWTLRTAKDLAIAWRRAGELERALETAEDVHARYVRLYGLDHPDTLAAAMSLANVRRNVGDAEGALELASDTVQRYPAIYGADHPYNIACTGNLAVLRRITGDPVGARELNERSLVQLETRLGRDHHYCLSTATNLASDLARLGDMEAARLLGQNTLPRLKRLLGENHPMTLACAGNLAADLKDAGLAEDAEILFEDTKERYVRTLGLEHPDARVYLERRHLDTDFDPPPI